MTTLLVWIIPFTLLGGILSVLAAAAFLVLPALWRERLLPSLISFAIGSLLGAAFLALLPHAFESPFVQGAHGIMLAVLLGLLLFFTMEKMVLWRHCHSDNCEAHTPEISVANTHSHQDFAAGRLILIGDSIHNFIDGILIAAAFLTDVHLGVVTSLAVIAHEIPQEVGDFAILLQSGYSRARAFAMNIAVSLTTVIGGVLAYYSLSSVQQWLPYVLALAASSFIYVAVADLIPGLHKRLEVSATVQQLILIVCGVGLIYLMHSMLH